MVFLLDKLLEIAKEINEIESQRLIISLSLYNKKIEEIKSKKINIINDIILSRMYDLSGKVKNNNDVQNKVKSIINDYIEIIDKIIEIYSRELLGLQKHLQEAELTSKYLINDIIKAYGIYQKDMNEQNRNEVLKLVQKKLNYDVIIEECENRIELCIDEATSQLDAFIIEPKNEIKKIEKKSLLSTIISGIKDILHGSKNKVDNIISGLYKDINIYKKNGDIIIKNVRLETVYFDMQVANVLSRNID